MPTRLEVMIAMLIALVSAAWLSPCCCQSAWVAEQGAALLTSTAAEETCRCCTQPDPAQDCCPADAKGCTQSIGKMVPLTVAPEIVPTHVWVIWTAEPAMTGSLACRSSFGECVGRAHPPDVTLLGLGCALTI